MIFYTVIQSNRKGATKDKYYGRSVHTETIDLDALADHMCKHNCPYSKGQIKGLITDMVSCLKELVLEGNSVKIPNLGIFSCGLRTKGSLTSEEFDSSNILATRLLCRPTGELRKKQLLKDKKFGLKKVKLCDSSNVEPEPDPDEDHNNPSKPGGGDQGGSQKPGGGDQGGSQKPGGGDQGGSTTDPDEGSEG